MTIKNISKLYSLATILLLLISVGCSPSIKRMIPNTNNLTLNSKQKSIKILEATGNKVEKGKLIMSVQLMNLEPEDLTILIRDSFTKTGLFSKVVLSGEADYTLSANIKYQSQRAHTNAAVETFLRIEYKIINYDQTQVVWEEEIGSSNDVKITQKLNGITRSVHSFEGAVRQNIERLIQKISKLPL